MTIAAVVLAAGASTRLGTPKQLVMLGGETLLERAVRVAKESGCEPVVVVLGAVADAVREGARLDKCVVVVNELWGEGMGSSLRLGIAAVGDVSGAVVVTCDMPGVTALHLRELMASGETTGSGYGGRVGVPAYFPKARFADLRALVGDAGARGLLREAGCVDLVGGEFDLDTVEDLERVRAVFGG